MFLFESAWETEIVLTRVYKSLDDNSKGAFTDFTASGFSFSDDDGIYFNLLSQMC